MKIRSSLISKLFFLELLSILLVACGTTQLNPTLTPTFVPTTVTAIGSEGISTRIPSPIHTSTNTPEPSDTLTPSPSPTNTSSPEPTNTAPSTSSPDLKFNLSQVNEDGFGNPMNHNSGALEVFNSYLYVGTRNPETGAEIWRYDGSDWEQVMKEGFNNEIEMIDDFFVFNNSLYAGTWAFREEGRVEKGGEVWRSSDGLNWEIVVEDGFGGGPIQAEVMRFFILNDHIYASTWSWDEDESINGLMLWRSTSGDPESWEMVTADGFGNPGNKAMVADDVYDGKLYVGTMGIVGGLWGEPIGRRGHFYFTTDGVNWSEVGDIIEEQHIIGVSALASFKNNLYAAIIAKTPDLQPIGKVYRCAICDGSDWKMVFDGPYLHAPTWRKLSLNEFKDFLFVTIGNDEYGIEIWNTYDGISWERIAGEGIDDTNNLRTYWDNGATIFNDKLYLGVNQFSTGTEIWEIFPTEN